MKTIAERHNKLKSQSLYLIIAMLVFLVFILWLKEARRTEEKVSDKIRLNYLVPKYEQAARIIIVQQNLIDAQRMRIKELKQDISTHHSVNGKWTEVEERRFYVLGFITRY